MLPDESTAEHAGEGNLLYIRYSVCATVVYIGRSQYFLASASKL